MSTLTIHPTIGRRALLALLAALTTFATLSLPPNSASAEEGIALDATLDGEPLGESSSNDPIELVPASGSILRMEVANDGETDVDLTRARLEGRALGVVFVAYDVSLDATIPAGEARTIEVPIQFYDLDDQANGLLPATLKVFGVDGGVVAEQGFTIDVRGRLTSIVGVFALTVIVLTAIGLALLSRQVATRRLPANRWHRAMQFAPVGLGVGLILTIALAVLRIAAPYGMVWLPLLTIPTAVAFGLGYLAPGPIEPDDDVIPEDLGLEHDVPEDLGLEHDLPEDLPRPTALEPPRTNGPDDPRATRPSTRPLTDSLR